MNARLNQDHLGLPQVRLVPGALPTRPPTMATRSTSSAPRMTFKLAPPAPASDQMDDDDVVEILDLDDPYPAVPAHTWGAERGTRTVTMLTSEVRQAS